MHDWNAVITFHQKAIREAFDFFQNHGHVAKTDYYNVLVMRAEDPPVLLETLHEHVLHEPESLAFLSRFITVDETFSFQSPREFEDKAQAAAWSWCEGLKGKGFHVRMHRRGFKGKLSSTGVERLLNNSLLEKLEAMGEPGHISFEDPDAILALETVGQRGGMSLWKREALRKYPFLHLD